LRVRVYIILMHMTSLGAYQGLTVVVGLIAILFLNPVQIFIAFVVLGQGHFFLGYLYKIKSRKINWRMLGWYLILLLAVFSLPLFLSNEAVLVTTALLFSIHFFFDEARIMAGENNISIPLIIPPILLFFSSLLNNELNIDYIPESIVLSVVIFFSTALSKGVKELLSKEIIYVNGFTIFFIIAYFANLNFSGEAIFGSIVLMHIFTWYLFYQKKTWPNKKLNRQYILDVIFVNVLVIALFFLFDNGFMTEILSLLFLPVFYYCWAILHIITSSGTLWNSTKNYFT
jgi:hypothetical protein